MLRLILFALLFGACSDSQSKPIAPLPQLVQAAVEIVADGCPGIIKSGTGMLIEPGRILTAAHVVAGAESIEVRIDGSVVAGTLLQFDPINDLAIIGIEPSLGTPIPIGAKQPGPDTAGQVVLFRKHQAQLVTIEMVRPVTIKTKDIYGLTDVNRSGYEVLAQIQVGDSGSVIVVDGKAVAALWARSRTAEGRAWAIDLVSTGEQIIAHIDEEIVLDSGECVR